MMLQKRDPFADLLRLQDVFSRAFSEVPGQAFDSSRATAWAPTVDVYEDAERMTFKFDVPEIKKDELSARVENGVLTVEGERRLEFEDRRDNYHRIERSFGRFARSFSLPNTIDPESIAAELQNGVLRLTLTKRPEAKARTIDIKG